LEAKDYKAGGCHPDNSGPSLQLSPTSSACSVSLAFPAFTPMPVPCGGSVFLYLQLAWATGRRE